MYNIFFIFNPFDFDEVKKHLISTDKMIIHEAERINSTWQIKEYPNFLKSCSMSDFSWDYLKLKFRIKLLASQVQKKSQNFTVCFTGTSVTAGHDSPHSISFPVLTETAMNSLFKKVGVNFVSRNVAMSNNPCMPYNICVKTFCGDDSDMIIWEQTYFCDFDDDYAPVLEQFIRQALAIPSNPILVMTDSATPNWEEKKCSYPIIPYTLTETDQTLLSTPLKQVATSLNDDERILWHDNYARLEREYSRAGFQLWRHLHYAEKYKCQGPYIREWGEGVAGWHPSKLGHQLRKDHYVYFWSAAWQEVIRDLLRIRSENSEKTPQMLLQEALDEQTKLLSKRLMPRRAIFDTKISDNMQCFTNYEPRTNLESSLSSLVISGLKGKEGTVGWDTMILEQLLPQWETLKAAQKEFGYKDFKHVLVANKDSGPLSLYIKPKKDAPIYICEPAYFIGKKVELAGRLYRLDPKIYLTRNVPFKAAFAFDEKTARQVQYHHVTETGGRAGEICVKTVSSVPRGSHVLTIVPRHEDKALLMLATILLP